MLEVCLFKKKKKKKILDFSFLSLKILNYSAQNNPQTISISIVKYIFCYNIIYNFFYVS